MSIFPSEVINVSDLIKSTVVTSTKLPLAKEYAWDFSNNDFLLYSGKNVMVTGKEAVKIWIWKALHTKKNRYKAYTNKFGHDLELLINPTLSRGALRSELERNLRETLLINPYITGVKTIEIEIDGSKTIVSFTATTVYGEVSLNV